MEIVVIRGATTVIRNTSECILEESKKLLEEIIYKNQIKIEDIIQITFTATKDLDAVYPAVAARSLGILDAALMCMQEMHVEGALTKCIRVALMCKSVNHNQKSVVHCYLKEARKLRPDLVVNKED